MRSATVCLVLLLGLASAAPAQTPVPTRDTRDDRWTVGLTIENDIFGGTDRYYSNGFLFTFQSPSAFLPSPVAWLDRQLDAAFGTADLRWGLSFGQSIYTPQDTQRRSPDPRDRPYAGYLYGAATLVRTADAGLPWQPGRRTGSQTLFELQLGVVGPSALGEFVQNNWHDLLRIRNAEGWDRQLKDEFAATALVDRRWRLPVGEVFGVEAEVIPAVGAALGNVQTYASAGATFRIGDGLRRDWGPVRIRPALAGSAFLLPPQAVQPAQEFGWYVFGGVEGRAVLRDIFLDGNTWRDGPRVDRRPFVGDVTLGLAVVWDEWRLAYTQTYRAEEFYGQRGRQSFGSVNLSRRF